MAFPARFESPGFCPGGCGNRIHIGDLVDFDQDRQLMHVECLPTFVPEVVQCPDCRGTKPCRCDET